VTSPESALVELDAARQELEEATVARAAAIERRRRAIESASEAGVSRRQVAARLGVTGGRVQQILDETAPSRS
jgi:DNA-directed RNA polymerase specialized sigma subunit